MSIGFKTGVTYHSDFKNMKSITTPVIDNDVRMGYKGHFEKDWDLYDVDFDSFGYGLKKNRHNSGTIFCKDSSKLFSMGLGYVGMILSFPKSFINGVYSGLLNNVTINEHFLWGVNPGKTKSYMPCLYSSLTNNGIEFTVWSSACKFTLIDQYSNFDANTDIFMEFLWDKDGIIEYSEIGYLPTMLIRMNGSDIVVGNAPIFNDSISNLSCYILDTPFLYSNLECTIRSLVIANEIPERIEDDWYSSSSSSSSSSSEGYSTSSSSSSSSEGYSTSSSSSSLGNSTSSSSSSSSISSSSSSSYGYSTSSSSSSSSSDPYGDWVWYESSGDVYITGYVGTDTDVVMPNEIDGMPVVSFTSGTFSLNTALENLTIADNVTSISNDSFNGCRNMETINISYGVTSIGINALRTRLNGTDPTSFMTINVDALNPNYSSSDGVLFNKSQTILVRLPDARNSYSPLPSSVTTFGSYSFAYTNIGTGFSVSGSNVATISGFCFSNCQQLTSLALGDGGLTVILENAFMSCSSLAEVTFYGINAPTTGLNIYQGTPSGLNQFASVGTSGWTTPTWPTSTPRNMTLV
jgi:hypothetical protein